MTKQLYLQDSYLFKSRRNITAQGQDEKGIYILLDQTIFYPQGGGQPSDQGKIEGNGIELEVLQVRQVENEIRHYVSSIQSETLVGSSVSCVIDQERRILNARYHTAGHLLGNVIESIYPQLKAVKGHSFPKEAYVEFQGFGIPDIIQIADALQKAIQDNLLTQAFEIDPISFENKFYKLSYQIPGNKVFRVMQIGNYPPIPCGGTHLANTKEIGNVVINKIKVKNNVVRVSYEMI